MSEEIINEVVEPIAVETPEVSSEPLLAAEPVVVPEREVPATQEEISSFVDGVPDEYKSFVEKKGFKDLGSALKSLQSLESKFGKRFEDLTADELKSINGKFGAPENADDYGIELSDAHKSDAILGGIHNDLFEAGIPKEQAKVLMDKVLGKIEAQNKDSQVELQLAQDKQVETIKSEFGSAFEARKDLANKALKEFGGEEAILAIQEAGLASHPAMFKMLSEVGKLISEDSPAKTSETRNFGITPQEASQKIAELRADPAFADRLRDVRHPGHNEALAQIEKYYRLQAGKR